MSSTKKRTRSRDQQAKIDAKLIETVPSATTMAEDFEDEALIFAPPSTDEFTEAEDDTEENDISVTSNPDETEDILQEEQDEAEETYQDDAGKEVSQTDLEAFLDFQKITSNVAIKKASPHTINRPVASPSRSTQAPPRSCADI